MAMILVSLQHVILSRSLIPECSIVGHVSFQANEVLDIKFKLFINCFCVWQLHECMD